MWKKIGGLVGFVAIVTLLIAVVQLIVSKIAIDDQDSVQATQIALQSLQINLADEQLRVQREIATLQANAIKSGPTATAVAKSVAELQSTSVALATQEAQAKAAVTPKALPTASTKVYSIKEDFEDAKVQMEGFSSGSSKWKIATDGTSNNAYEVDHRDRFPV